MTVVYCVMKNPKELFAVYGTKERAEVIAANMTEKHNENYYVETLQVL